MLNPSSRAASTARSTRLHRVLHRVAVRPQHLLRDRVIALLAYARLRRIPRQRSARRDSHSTPGRSLPATSSDCRPRSDKQSPCGSVHPNRSCGPAGCSTTRPSSDSSPRSEYTTGIANNPIVSAQPSAFDLLKCSSCSEPPCSISHSPSILATRPAAPVSASPAHGALRPPPQCVPASLPSSTAHRCGTFLCRSKPSASASTKRHLPACPCADSAFAAPPIDTARTRRNSN